MKLDEKAWEAAHIAYWHSIDDRKEHPDTAVDCALNGYLAALPADDALIIKGLKSGLMCAEILVQQGGACGVEIYEEELPIIKAAIRQHQEGAIDVKF